MLYKVNNNKLIIIYSHGYMTDIGLTHEFLLRLSKDIDVNIISYDYEGYGLSMSKHKPSEERCIRSIDAVYTYLVDNGYKSNNIILYDSSIGSGPSIDLASRISIKCKLNNDPNNDLRGL